MPRPRHVGKSMNRDLSSASPDNRIDPTQRARFQVDPGWNFGLERLVEWRDVDAFRHANHTSFLLWFEAARNRYLEAMGLPRLSPDGPGPAMMTLEARYLKPLAFHETGRAHVGTPVTNAPNVRR